MYCDKSFTKKLISYACQISDTVRLGFMCNILLHSTENMLIIKHLYPGFKVPHWYVSQVEIEDIEEENPKLGAGTTWNGGAITMKARSLYR